MLIGSSNINARACYKRQNLTIGLVVDEASVIAAGNLVAWKIYRSLLLLTMFNLNHSSTRYAKIMNWKDEGDYQVGIDSASDPPQLMVVWEQFLQHLNFAERIFFLSTYCAITVFATIGNVLTLYVVFTRLNYGIMSKLL